MVIKMDKNLNKEKISVREYLDNPELIEVYYTQYDLKVNICDVILDQVIKKDGCYYYIDSSLLDRIKTQVIIESVTNIDLSIEDEVGLNGYDLLCKEDRLDDLLNSIPEEFNRFNKILELKVKDFNNNNGSLRGFLHYSKIEIINKYNEFVNSTTEFIQNLDAKEISDNIVNFIESADKKRNKK